MHGVHAEVEQTAPCINDASSWLPACMWSLEIAKACLSGCIHYAGPLVSCISLPMRIRIPAGGTERVEVFVVPLQVGSGVAYPARITYKAEPDSTTEQVPCTPPQSFICCLPSELSCWLHHVCRPLS